MTVFANANANHLQLASVHTVNIHQRYKSSLLVLFLCFKSAFLFFLLRFLEIRGASS